VSREFGTDSLTLRLDLPERLAWFDGHFPGEPILAAVVQVDWAIHYGRQLGFDPLAFSGMPRLKFKAVITPGDELMLRLTRKNSRLKFAYSIRARVHSEGTIEFLIDDQ
jgi:3-hydroxymyristoyl/3-hydroxydecanoyl-(acyl carrier protein) dehydratase